MKPYAQLVPAFTTLLLLTSMSPVEAHANWIFATPINLGEVVNSSYQDSTPSISTDGLTLYFFSDRPGGVGGWDIWVTSRPSLGAPWSDATNLGAPVNTNQSDASPSISSDGLSLYFERGIDSRDIWTATRLSLNDPWNVPVSLGSIVNSDELDTDPEISPDRLSLLFDSDRPGGFGSRDIWMTTRNSTADAWETPSNLGDTINGAGLDAGASISGDGLTLFFMSDRESPGGNFDLFVSTRPTLSDDWTVPTKLLFPIDVDLTNSAPNISFDGHTLYFVSNRPGGNGSLDIWYAQLIPEPCSMTLFLLSIVGCSALGRAHARHHRDPN